MKIISILLLVTMLFTISCGCVTFDNYAKAMGGSPSARLELDPTLIAACQYEFWENTTRDTPTLVDGAIKNETKSDVYWICYYRDNHTTIQKMGAFTNTASAGTYLWYYYENGNYPMIYTRK